MDKTLAAIIIASIVAMGVITLGAVNAMQTDAVLASLVGILSTVVAYLKQSPRQ